MKKILFTLAALMCVGSLCFAQTDTTQTTAKKPVVKVHKKVNEKSSMFKHKAPKKVVDTTKTAEPVQAVK